MTAEMDVLLARAIDRVFEAGGGPKVIAEQLGIQMNTISSWHKRIPMRHLFKLQAITGISPEEMRPDLFQPPLESTSTPYRRFKSREARVARRVVLGEP